MQEAGEKLRTRNPQVVIWLRLWARGWVWLRSTSVSARHYVAQLILLVIAINDAIFNRPTLTELGTWAGAQGPCKAACQLAPPRSLAGCAGPLKLLYTFSNYLSLSFIFLFYISLFLFQWQYLKISCYLFNICLYMDSDGIVTYIKMVLYMALKDIWVLYFIKYTLNFVRDWFVQNLSYLTQKPGHWNTARKFTEKTRNVSGFGFSGNMYTAAPY